MRSRPPFHDKADEVLQLLDGMRIGDAKAVICRAYEVLRSHADQTPFRIQGRAGAADARAVVAKEPGHV